MEKAVMWKKLTLLVLALLTIASFISYLIITEKYLVGSAKVAEGKKQLAEGEQMLARGKAKLASGEQQLSQAKRAYHKARPALWAAAVFPVAEGVLLLAGNKIVKSKISEGNQLVAQGKGKVEAGEQQLKEGKLQLQQGIQQLAFANNVRIACLVATFIFGFMLVALGFYWRKVIRKKK
jgi:uncharacterized phage infection (PIP) family protein YhgE